MANRIILQFTSSQEDGCTSSVMDVFTSLHSVVRAINDLHWTDTQRHADFVAEVALVSLLYNQVLTSNSYALSSLRS
jgi:hypothetical protein